MFISFVDSTTVKEIKTQAEWHEKQSKKLMRTFYAEFSRQEKHRAETCKPGKATKMLSDIAFDYLGLEASSVKTIDMLKMNRPSTKTLLKNTSSLFYTDRPYYNKYFASWWYKNNWSKIVEIYFGV